MTDRKHPEIPQDLKLFADKVVKITLEHIYSEAVSAGRFLTPDAAIRDLSITIERLIGKRTGESGGMNLQRTSPVAAMRKAHHMAVDFFYRKYFPQKGAPKLSERYLEALLRWRKQGLSYGKIANRLGLEANSQTRDRIRKQLAIANRK